jgi:uncharacterized SAM-binding protein YcdF (DUF218 family)
MWKRIAVLAVLIIVGILVFRHAGSYLVVNEPEHADLILVLGGGNGDLRYWNGVRLMKEGWAPRLMLDVFSKGIFYGNNELDLARDFVKRTAPEQATVCPLVLNSTYGEALHVADCVRDTGVKSILVVTSDYHTRRAVEILRKRLPQYHISVYAAQDPYFFDVRWWRTREWAKTVFAEWQKYLWWELVDRWKKDVVVAGSG